MRKGTLRAYVAMLSMEDSLLGHEFYGRAAAGAVDAYLRLHDAPLRAAANGAGDAALLAGMSAEEAKKLKLARKKEVSGWVGGKHLRFGISLLVLEVRVSGSLSSLARKGGAGGVRRPWHAAAADCVCAFGCGFVTHHRQQQQQFLRAGTGGAASRDK